MYTIKDDNANNDIGNETISDSSIQDIEEEDLMADLTKDKDKDMDRYRDKDRDKEGEGEGEDKQSYDLGRWTPNEHLLFLEALVKYGNEWKQIQEHIRTRSSAQARSHAQKYFIRLKKEFKELTDVNLIKQKIQQKFQYELQESFTPENINNFLDIMIKLIYIREENIINYPFSTIQRVKMGKNKQMGDMGLLQRKKRNKNKNKKMLLNNISISNSTNKQALYRKSQEKNIFKIERNLNRKQSIEVERNTGIKKKTSNNKNSPSKKNRVKSHMANIKKRIPNLKANLNPNVNVNPPCINYFTFNMIDNSTNNYLNTNLKHIGSNTSIGLPMNQMGFPPIEGIRERDRNGDIEAELGNTFRLETKETKSNPFFIQFDPEENRDGLGDNLNQDNNFNDYFPF